MSTTATKERPILFSGSMVRAILDGRKTQTRRVMKPQPKPCNDGTGRYYIGPCRGGDPRRHIAKLPTSDPIHALACPYGVPGDRLWVREAWGRVDPNSCGDTEFHTVVCTDGSDAHVVYRADGDFEWNIEDGDEYDTKGNHRSCWKPSIHMPRWASRITLEVVRVWVERVQEISTIDCFAEGCMPIDQWPSQREVVQGTAADSLIESYKDARSRDVFSDLWDSINGKKPGCAWDDNPWVWCVEFMRINEEASS